MKRFYLVFSYLLAFQLLIACSSGVAVTPEELTNYILDEDNGLYKSNVVNEIKTSVLYRPTDLWVHQELNGQETDTARVQALRRKYSDYYYFTVSFSNNNKEALHQTGNFGQYSELLQTMSFRMPQYVSLTTSLYDTIPVGDFMLNRTYGMSSSTDILFVFNKEKSRSRDWVQFNLNEFGLGVGNQRFRFRTQDIEESPEVYKD